MFEWSAHSYYDELIPTNTPDCIAGPEAMLQLGGYATQKLVSSLVTLGVVDELEAIQIDDPN